MKLYNQMHLDFSDLPQTGINSFLVKQAREFEREGKKVIRLGLEVRSEDQVSTIIDELCEDDPYKMLCFLRAANLVDCYKEGELTPAACIGAKGHVRLFIGKAANEKKAAAANEKQGAQYTSQVNGYMSPKMSGPQGFWQTVKVWLSGQ